MQTGYQQSIANRDSTQKIPSAAGTLSPSEYPGVALSIMNSGEKASWVSKKEFLQQIAEHEASGAAMMGVAQS